VEIVNLGRVSIIPEPVFETYKDKTGQYRFRLKAANGEIIAVSEAYSSKDGCLNGIESVKKNAPKAKIVLVDNKGKEEKVVEVEPQKKSEERKRGSGLVVSIILLVIIIFLILMLITVVIK